MAFTLPWSVNKLVSTHINNGNAISDPTYGTSSLKNEGKTLLMGETRIVGNTTANNLTATSLIPTNRNELSNNKYIGSTPVTLNWGDPENIIFNGNGNWTVTLPSVVSGGIARVGARFTFGFTYPWTGTKTITVPSTEYIYDGGTGFTTSSIALVASSNQNYIQLLCVNYTPGGICWAVVARPFNPATAYDFTASSISLTNRNSLLTNRYLTTATATLALGDPEQIFFGLNGNQSVTLPSVVGVSGVLGTRFIFGLVANQSGTKTIQAQTNQFIYDGGTNNSRTSLTMSITTDYFYTLVCVNQTAGQPCWAVVVRSINPSIPYTFPALQTFNGGLTASATQTINFGTNAPTMRGTNITLIPNSALDASVVLTNTTQTISGTKTFSGSQTFTGGITASGIQTINFGTNAPTMSGANISATSIPNTALQTSVVLTDNEQIITKTKSFTPASIPITISNYNFATPALGLNISQTQTAPYSAITGWTLTNVVGTASPVDIIHGFAGYINTYETLYPDYPAVTQALSIGQTGAGTFRIQQSLTFTETGSYQLTFWIWGAYNTYRTTQTINASINSYSAVFIGVEQLWTKCLLNFIIGTTGSFSLVIDFINTVSFSVASITNIQIEKQTGVIVSDGGVVNNQLINQKGLFTTSIENRGPLRNYGYLQNYGGLGLYAPYSNGSVCIGTTQYGSVNTGDGGSGSVFIGSSNVVSSPSIACIANQCIGIGSGALEQLQNASRLCGIGFRALRYNSINADNISVGYSAGELMGYNGSASTRNVIIGNYALNKPVLSNDNVSIGHNNMSSVNFVTGTNNCVSVGSSSMTNVCSSHNTQIGFGAVQNMVNTTSTYNTFVGAQVCNTQSGASNVMTNCTFLGATSNVSAAGNYSNSTAVGYGALINANNRIILGRSTEETYAMGGLVIPSTNGLNASAPSTTINFGSNAPTMSGANIGLTTIAVASIVGGSDLCNRTATTSVTGAYSFSSTATFTGGITASGTQTINFGSNAPSMLGSNIFASSIPNTALQSSVMLTSNNQTITGAKLFTTVATAFTGGITASATQTINFGTNAPTMRGTNITLIPNSALDVSVVLTDNAQTISGSKIFTGEQTFTADITASDPQTINFGTNAPVMSGANISATSIPNTALQTDVMRTDTTETITGLKTFTGLQTFTGGITASGTQTINLGTNAPTMSGANISATSIPNTALQTSVMLTNTTETITGQKTFNGGLIIPRNSTAALNALIGSTIPIPTLLQNVNFNTSNRNFEIWNDSATGQMMTWDVSLNTIYIQPDILNITPATGLFVNTPVEFQTEPVNFVNSAITSNSTISCTTLTADSIVLGGAQYLNQSAPIQTGSFTISSSVIYEFYPINISATSTVTLPVASAALVGKTISFRRVAGSAVALNSASSNIRPLTSTTTSNAVLLTNSNTTVVGNRVTIVCLPLTASTYSWHITS